MKITSRNIDGFIAKPPADLMLALFYGRDLGLISTRADRLAKNAVADTSDPFATTHLTSDTIAQDPAVLYDSAAAIPATSDKRLVRVAHATDAIVGAVVNLLARPLDASLTIITAQDLNTKSALVKAVENHPRAAGIGCYPDQPQDIARMAQTIFSHHKITCDREALAWISSRLGGDHVLSRSELEKLALMAGEGGTITLAQAQSALGDSAAISGYEVAAAVAGGNMHSLIHAFDRAMADAIAPEAILRITMHHFTRLFRLACMMAEKNMTAEAAVRAYKPPIFFSEQRPTIQALTQWSHKKCLAANERLHMAETQSRQGVPAATATAHALLALCQMGNRQMGRR